MRPHLATAPTLSILLLILFAVLVGPVEGFPAVAGRPHNSRADDLIAGTDFLSVFIGSALPRSKNSHNTPPSTSRSRDSTTAPEEIGFGARLAPKSSTTTTIAPTIAATTTTMGPPDLQQDLSLQYDDTSHSKSADEEFVPPDNSSTEFTTQIGSSASELSYQTFLPPDINSSSDLGFPSEGSIAVVTDIVTSKQELISLTAGDPSDGDQRTSDGELQSASRITSVYVQHNNDNLRHPHHSLGFQSASASAGHGGGSDHQPKTGASYQNPSSTVHYHSLPAQVVESNTQHPGIIQPEINYHGNPVNEQKKNLDYHGHSTNFPQSSSNSWFSTNPTEATKIVITHPGHTTLRAQNPTVQQVISVRVSSSVVQGPSSPPQIGDTSNGEVAHYFIGGERRTQDESPASHGATVDGELSHYIQHSLSQPQDTGHKQEVVENQQVVPTSLVTEDQPAATAVQRSQFSVEESPPSEVTPQQPPPPHRQPATLYQQGGAEQTIATVVEVPAPVINYETRVSSPTSNSRVQFSRGSGGPPPSQPVPIRRPGGWVPRAQKSYHGSHNQQQQQPQLPAAQHSNVQLHPERNYEQPEQNYEVDEQISVVTNGRVHGVQQQDSQQTTPSTLLPLSEHPQGDGKAGYVVEGRGYRRYRVEERTSDGFIVGEYGVLNSEGDPLHAVRYTADGTAPTKLIDKALSHFLSL